MRDRSTVKVKTDARPVRINNTAGYATTLEPFSVVSIPVSRLQRYLRAGCKLAQGIDPGDEAPQGEDRLAQIVAAVRALIEQGDPTKFTGAGEPRVRAVEALTGFDITKEEMIDAYNVVLESDDPGGEGA